MIHLHGTQAVAFRVLIVTEEAIQREILARCVEMLGWTADTAANLDDARNRYFHRRHSVVVIDLALGQRDGLRLLRHLRRDHADPSLIFIAGAEAGVDAASFQAAQSLGLRVAGLLARPIDPYRLHA